jgi:hypothetical protein
LTILLERKQRYDLHAGYWPVREVQNAALAAVIGFAFGGFGDWAGLLFATGRLGANENGANSICGKNHSQDA